jgi:hypothetical protein
MRDRRHALKKFWDARNEFEGFLEESFIPYHRANVGLFGHVMQVGRIRLLVDYRPLSVPKYEAITLRYFGPYIPFVVSRFRHWRHETRDKHTVTPYQLGEYAALVPAFTILPKWPHFREWRWHPPVELNALALLDRLRDESQKEPWPVNRRGFYQIPYKTGCSGKIINPKESVGPLDGAQEERTWQPEAEEFVWTVMLSKTNLNTESTKASSASSRPID